MLRAINNVRKLFPLGGKQNKNRTPPKRALLKDGKNKVSAALLRNSTLQQQHQGCRTNKKQSWVLRCHSRRDQCHQEMVNMALPIEGPMKDYTVKELIGKGQYGQVYTARHNETGEVVAVKEVDDYQAGMTEAGIMAMLKDCPSAVHLKDAGVVDGQEGRFFIVMELCEGGDLGAFLEENGALTSAQMVPVAKEVLQVVRTCQEYRILHGDIKPCNLAIGSEEEHQLLKTHPEQLKAGWLKLIDFGTSIEVGLGACNRPVGSPTYWAPEVFGRSFKMEADVWSVGVLLFHLQTSCFPFWSNDELVSYKSSTDLVKAINSRQPDFCLLPSEPDRELEIDLLSGLLQKIPDQRMKPTEALAHPWLAGAE